MYAVIRCGGKQYKVAPGDTVKIERLAGKVGSKVTISDVIAVRTEDDRLVSGKAAAEATVVGKIVEQGRRAKELVMKYKTGGQYKILRGHRQNYTAFQVSEIKL
jgi:large subunit ribosomal protein L21